MTRVSSPHIYIEGGWDYRHGPGQAGSTTIPATFTLLIPSLFFSPPFLLFPVTPTPPSLVPFYLPLSPVPVLLAMSRLLPHHLLLVLDLLQARPPPLLAATPTSPCLLAAALPPRPVPVPPVCVAAHARPIHNQPRARFTLRLTLHLSLQLALLAKQHQGHPSQHSGYLRIQLSSLCSTCRLPLLLFVRRFLLRACWSGVLRTQDYGQVARAHGAVVPTSAGSTPESPDALLVGGLLASLRPRTVAVSYSPPSG